MRRLGAALAILLASLLFGGAKAQPLVELVAKNCTKELNKYCSRVTGGKGRLALCLFAHEDKLSIKCDAAVFFAVDELMRVLASQATVVHACEADAHRLCEGAKIGEGNVLACLNAQKTAVSAPCNQAIANFATH